ncbi:MAG: hypothetical protein JSS68_14990 [Actinobacteria bacterium]|nr:hypothetical protein [Actinomycetota bacterium]
MAKSGNKKQVDHGRLYRFGALFFEEDLSRFGIFGKGGVKLMQLLFGIVFFVALLLVAGLGLYALSEFGYIVEVGWAFILVVCLIISAIWGIGRWLFPSE